MLTYAKLAIRNLRKNLRRSFYTLAAIATGSCALCLYLGYADKVYMGLELAAVHGEALGHITLAKRGFFNEGRIFPERYLLSEAELGKMLADLRSLDAVRVATPRLSFSGMASNGKISTIFLGQGEDPADSGKIRWSGQGRLRLLDGGRPTAGAIGSDLAKLLGVSRGESIVLMTSTMAGQVNALDFDMLNPLDTGSIATNDKFVLTSLNFAQRLLDVRGADRVVLMCADDAALGKCKQQVLSRMQAAGLDIEARTWMDLSNSYRPVKAMFDVVVWFLFAITAIVVFMAVVNTMSTSVFERFREIGTLRAIGMRRRAVLGIFSVEGAMLGFFGSALGCAVAATIALAVNVADLSYVPPNASRAVPFSISALPALYAAIGAFNMLLSVIASLMPSWRAASMEIVDALGHV